MKKVISMLMAVTLVVGCAKMNVNEPEIDKDGVAIQVKSTNETVKGKATRVPFFGNISSTNNLKARVVTYDKNGAIYANGTMIFEDVNTATVYESPITLGNPKFGVNRTDVFSLVGLYPDAGWSDVGVASSTLTSDVAKFTFNGSQDIMVAAITTTTPADAEDETYPTLTFKHQLTKLEIKVKAKDAVAAGLWFNVQKIVLSKVADNKIKNAFAYTLNSGDIAFAGAESTFPFYTIDNSLLPSVDPVYTSNSFENQEVEIEEADETQSNIIPVAYSMIAPFIATGTAADLTFTVSAKTADKNADGTLDDEGVVAKTVNVSIPVVDPELPSTSTKGYTYSITFTFSDTGLITATAEVIDWIDGGELEQIIM